MDILKIISYIGIVILGINTILYFTGFAKNSKAYKIFVAYLLAITAIQVTMEIHAINGSNNHYLSNYYLFLQFILLSFFFYYLFININTKSSAIVKYTSSVITLALIAQYIIYPAQYYTFNQVGLLLTSVVLTIYPILYLYELLSKKLPFYYASAGIFIYLISSALIFASTSSIVSFGYEISMYIWKLNGILFIIYQLLILWEWKQNFSQKRMRQE